MIPRDEFGRRPGGRVIAFIVKRKLRDVVELGRWRRRDQLACRGVPRNDLPIDVAGEYRFAVGRNGQGRNVQVGPGQVSQRDAGFDVDQAGGGCAERGGEEPGAIGCKKKRPVAASIGRSRM